MSNKNPGLDPEAFNLIVDCVNQFNPESWYWDWYDDYKAKETIIHVYASVKESELNLMKSKFDHDTWNSVDGRKIVFKRSAL